MKKASIFLILFLTTAGNSFGCAGFGRKTPGLKPLNNDSNSNASSTSGEPITYNPILAAIIYHEYKPQEFEPKSFSRASSPSLPIMRASESTSNNNDQTSTPDERTSSARLSARLAATSSSPQRIRRSKSLPELCFEGQIETKESNSPDAASSLSEATTTSPFTLSNASSIGSTSGNTSGARTPNDEGQLLTLLHSAATKLGYKIRDQKELAEYLKTQLVPLSRSAADPTEAGK